MTDREGRRVHVAAQPRRVSLDDGTAEGFEYLGIVLRRRWDGSPVDETWLPMGDEPSAEDDERLIAALHEAWLWTTEPEREADRLSGTL